MPQLRTVRYIPPRPICVKRAKVVHWHLVGQLTDIAAEPSTAVDELYKRIDVSSASAASNNACAAKLRHGYFFSGNKWANHASNRQSKPLLQCLVGGQGIYSEAQVSGVTA